MDWDGSAPAGAGSPHIEFHAPLSLPFFGWLGNRGVLSIRMRLVGRSPCQRALDPQGCRFNSYAGRSRMDGMRRLMRRFGEVYRGPLALAV